MSNAIDHEAIARMEVMITIDHEKYGNPLKHLLEYRKLVAKRLIQVEKESETSVACVRIIEDCNQQMKTILAIS